jgi:hypothetical protein
MPASIAWIIAWGRADTPKFNLAHGDIGSSTERNFTRSVACF